MPLRRRTTPLRAVIEGLRREQPRRCPERRVRPGARVREGLPVAEERGPPRRDNVDPSSDGARLSGPCPPYEGTGRRWIASHHRDRAPTVLATARDPAATPGGRVSLSNSGAPREGRTGFWAIALPRATDSAPDRTRPHCVFLRMGRVVGNNVAEGRLALTSGCDRTGQAPDDDAPVSAPGRRVGEVGARYLGRRSSLPALRPRSSRAAAADPPGMSRLATRHAPAGMRRSRAGSRSPAPVDEMPGHPLPRPRPVRARHRSGNEIITRGIGTPSADLDGRPQRDAGGTGRTPDTRGLPITSARDPSRSAFRLHDTTACAHALPSPMMLDGPERAHDDAIAEMSLNGCPERVRGGRVGAELAAIIRGGRGAVSRGRTGQRVGTVRSAQRGSQPRRHAHPDRLPGAAGGWPIHLRTARRSAHVRPGRWRLEG